MRFDDRSQVLEAIVTIPAGSDLSCFPSSTHLDDRVYAVGDGLYLIATWRGVDSESGQIPRSIVSIGWAESEHWARRAFGRAPDDLDVEPSPNRAPPSLVFLGRPSRLEHRAIVAHEQALSGPRRGPAESANYRFPDGKLLSHIDTGVGVAYYFDRANPRKGDLPTAFALDLPGSTEDVVVLSPAGAKLPWQ